MPATIPDIKAANDCDTDPQSVAAPVAQQLIAEAITPIAQVESLAVREALGRVVARDVKSAVCVPNHTNAAMDGYAVAARDLPAGDAKKTLRVVGVSMAGAPFGGEIKAGQAVRIMTGAVMPAGGDTVIVQERVELCGDDSNKIIIGGGGIKMGVAGANVRHAGEDLQIGDIAIAAGRRITAAHLGLAASLGIAELPVVRRPRIAFFSNGDELRTIGTPLAVGDLYDSNRYTLYGMLANLGVEMVDMGIVADDAAAVRDAIQRAAACADMVITSAGASAGDADYIRQTLAEIGTVIFHKVAVKPGRPLAFGKIGDALFFGLPGNPVSVMVTFDIFVKPALRQLGGETAAAPLALRVKTASPLKKRAGRTEYQRGILSAAADEVLSTGEQGSGMLHSMGEANCYIVLPSECTDVAIGEMVEVRPFSGGW